MSKFSKREDRNSLGRSRFRLKRSANLAAAVGLVVSGTGYAADGNFGLEEIVVTATKREMSLQDMGQSIQAFSTDQIEARGYSDLEDFAKGLPAVSFTGQQPGANDITFRGVTTGRGFGDAQTESSVSLYLDEVPVTVRSSQIDIRLIDVERLESLPGPQGTLFGSSSQTGTLRIITNKPTTDEFSGQVDAELGTTKGGDTSHQISGHVNIPVVDDKFAVRLVGYKIKEGGYIDNVLTTALATNETNADVASDDQNEIDVEGGRISALWNINEKWSATAGYSYQKQENEGVFWSSPALDDYEVARFFDDFKMDKWWTASLTLRGDLGFAEVVSSTSYFDRYNTYEFDNMVYDHFKTAAFGVAYAATSWGPFYDVGYISGTNTYTTDKQRFSQEIRLTSMGDSRFQWMVGGFYEKNDDEWLSESLNPGLSDLPIFALANAKAAAIIANGYETEYPLTPSDNWYTQYNTREVEQLAFFGEASYDITDRLKVTAGARWFQFEREAFQTIGFPFTTPPRGSEAEGGSVESESSSESDQVYKLGVQYELDENKMIYALWSQGFRLGGTNAIRSQGVNLPDSYDADSVDNYEVGIKSEWLDNRLQVNASYFFMDWEDYQINTRPPGAWWAYGIINGGGAESNGFELSFAFQATPNLVIDGSAFVGSAEFTEETRHPVNDSLLVPKDVDLPMSPDRKYSLSIEYTMPDIAFDGAEAWIRYDWSYQSEVFHTINASASGNSETIDSWDNSNLQFGLRADNDWSVTLRIKNLFDQKQVYFVSDRLNNRAGFFGTDIYSNLSSYARPREVTLAVQKKF